MNLFSLFRTKKPTVLDPLEAYQRWAETYDDVENNALLAAEQSVIEPMLQRLNLKGKRVLDAGCGTGRYLQILQRYRPKLLVGIDASPAMLEKAKTKIQTSNAVRIEMGHIDKLRLRNCSFDVVLCTLALDHLPDVKAGILELARVLRKGGTAVISVFHPYGKLLGWQRTFRVNTGDQKLYAARYFSYSHADYFETFRLANLRIESVAEPVVNEKLKPFYEAAHRLDLYERYRNFPLVLIFRLIKQ